jgi:hypothetical protein
LPKDELSSSRNPSLLADGLAGADFVPQPATATRNRNRNRNP